MQRGEPTLLYVIESEINFVKIGIGKNPETRLQAFQDASPFLLRLLHTQVSTVEYEKRLHMALAQYRANGEWYYGTKDLKDTVSSVLGPIQWLPPLTPLGELYWAEAGDLDGNKRRIRSTMPTAMQAIRLADQDGLENLILNSPDRVKLRQYAGQQVAVNVANLTALRRKLEAAILPDRKT